MTEQKIQTELQGIIKKIDRNMALYIQKTPNISESLCYSENLSTDGDWTGSFWTGMVIMAGILTGEQKYADYIDSYYDFYQKRIDRSYKDHDLGFLYQLYALNAYRWTQDMRYAHMAAEGAEALLHRYNPRGGYIRAWGNLIDPNNSGKIIIDCMMNLPLLFCVSQMTGNKAMEKAAANHANAALNHIRPDGSTHHTFDFEYVTGKPINGENEGGYNDESCWSRGMSWGIYGFYLAWMHTGENHFLNAAINLANYFIERLDENSMPKWDFILDENAPSPEAIDTSAAAITVSGLLDLCKVVDEKTAKRFKNAADKMLISLMENYSHTFDDKAEALLEKAYGGGMKDGKRVVRQMAAIWGDYYYMEALIKRSGIPLQMWSM